MPRGVVCSLGLLTFSCLVALKLASAPKTAAQPAVRVYMYASHFTPEFCATVRSLLFNSWDVTLFGAASDASPPATKRAKMTGPLQWLSEQPPNDIIVGLDAFDVLAQRPPQDLLNIFSHLHADVVYGAEKGCWPFVVHGNASSRAHYCEKRYAVAAPQDPRLPRFLNSGIVIGRAGGKSLSLSTMHALLTVQQTSKWDAAGVIGQIYKVLNTIVDFQVFRAGSSNGMDDDQELAAFVYLGGAFNVKLDFKSALAKSLYNSSDDLEPSTVPNSRDTAHTKQLWRDRISGSTPVFLHSNGDKMPFYIFNKTMWFSGMHLKDVHLPNSLIVHAANGSDVQFNSICPDLV